MSHVVRTEIQLTDPVALHAACDKLGLDHPVHGTHRMFDGTDVTGLIMTLPNWRYPVVINEENGSVAYDNYGGSWGAQVELDKLVQAYGVEKARSEALIHGLFVYGEQVLENGDVELELVDNRA